MVHSDLHEGGKDQRDKIQYVKEQRSALARGKENHTS